MAESQMRCRPVINGSKTTIPAIFPQGSNSPEGNVIVPMDIGSDKRHLHEITVYTCMVVQYSYTVI